MSLVDLPKTPGRNDVSNPFRIDRDWSHRLDQISSSPETMQPTSQCGRSTPRKSSSRTSSAASLFDSPDSHPKIRLPSLSSLTDLSFAQHGGSGAVTSHRPEHTFEAGTRQSSTAYEEAAHRSNSQYADRQPSFGRPHSHSAPMPYPKVESLFSAGRRANTGTDDTLSQSTTSSRSRSFSASDAADSVAEERNSTAPKFRASTQAKDAGRLEPETVRLYGMRQDLRTTIRPQQARAQAHRGEGGQEHCGMWPATARANVLAAIRSPILAQTPNVKQTLAVQTPCSRSPKSQPRRTATCLTYVLMHLPTVDVTTRLTRRARAHGPVVGRLRAVISLRWRSSQPDWTEHEPWGCFVDRDTNLGLEVLPRSLMRSGTQRCSCGRGRPGSMA